MDIVQISRAELDFLQTGPSQLLVLIQVGQRLKKSASERHFHRKILGYRKGLSDRHAEFLRPTLKSV